MLILGRRRHLDSILERLYITILIASNLRQWWIELSWYHVLRGKDSLPYCHDLAVGTLSLCKGPGRVCLFVLHIKKVMNNFSFRWLYQFVNIFVLNLQSIRISINFSTTMRGPCHAHYFFYRSFEYQIVLEVIAYNDWSMKCLRGSHLCQLELPSITSHPPTEKCLVNIGRDRREGWLM